MIGFLASRFIKDYQNTSDAAVRRAYGVLCGAVGIAINLLLFALKLFAGTLAGSVAVTADAFNNLSDAGASIVTLLGFRLAGQKPDPEHPFGHGRLEYISGLIVSIVILLMGFELLRDAVGAILHPEAVECSVLTVAILLISICAKFYMYCYNRGVGKKISAAAMQATAADSLSDCAATAAVLLCDACGAFPALADRRLVRLSRVAAHPVGGRAGGKGHPLAAARPAAIGGVRAGDPRYCDGE